MSCSQGAARPDRQTTLRLFATSAGFCQRPTCRRALFVDSGHRGVHIAEVAHVFAVSNVGPRARTALSNDDRGAYDNLILLCPTCHTTVDKLPEDFPSDLMQEWKKDHVTRIAEVFGAIEYGSREAAREALEPALSENRQIFNDYGPNNEYRMNPESEYAQIWRLKVRSCILPNNRKLLAILDANRHHLFDVELRTLEEFRQHVKDMEARHLVSSVAGAGRQFPVDMHAILEGGDNAKTRH